MGVEVSRASRDSSRCEHPVFGKIEANGAPAFDAGRRMARNPYTEDFDQGTVVAFDGENVEVAWQSGERTTQSYTLLRLGWSR